MPRYELWLTDSAGKRLSVLGNVLSMRANRVVNNIGTIELVLPSTFDVSSLRPDYMVQVWRAPDGGVLTLWRVYFLRRWSVEMRGDLQTVRLHGYDPNYLLSSRIIAAYAGSAQAEKSAAADDMMKAIVREAFAATVAPAPDPGEGSRAVTALTVQADVTAGPTLQRGFAWQNVLTTLQRIGEAAYEAGTEVFFDVAHNSVSASTITFIFRTAVGQLGVDRSDAVIFSPDRGNVREALLEHDYSDESTHVYAGGQGREDERDIGLAYDTARASRSAWGRREAFAYATMQSTSAAVLNTAMSRLLRSRPVKRLRAAVVNTGEMAFGRDWDFGDRVTVRFGGIDVETIVRAVTLTVDGDSAETVEVVLVHEE